MNQESENKRDPRKHIDTVIKREVTSALELRAETTFLLVLLYFDLRPGRTCHSKMMHWKEVTHSDGTYEEKSRRWIWLTKWDMVKFPWYTHRLMHRKRVTCERHDSYFRLMTIKHAIPKIEWAIEWALNYYITRSRQEVRQLGSREVADKLW